MENNQFSIFPAIKNAYAFAGREWLYLLKVGTLPILLQIGTSLFLQFQRADASRIEGYLWSLPTTALFAWFTFVQVRLLLLGERVHHLPLDRPFQRTRNRALQLSVLTSLLFNMALSSALALLILALESGQWGVDWMVTLGGLFLLGGLFWSVRFSVVPVLAAVHYPIRPVLKQIHGMMFSLRLISMGVVCLLLPAFLFKVVLESFIIGPIEPAVELKLTTVQQILLIVCSAPFSLVIAVLLNASIVYALKQILGNPRDRTYA